MLDLNSTAIGITLFVIGLAILAMVFVFVRLFPKLRPLKKQAAQGLSSLNIPPHDQAVLLIQDGGRIAYLNEPARKLFNLGEELPNLESLARRTQPSETFLTLCATEGQARLSLNGRSIEAISYHISTGSQNFFLVSLHRPQITIDNHTALDSGQQGMDVPINSPQTGAVSSQAFSIITELTQRMASSLDLEDALQTILESVERLVPSDFLEITLWEEEYQHLAPYRLVTLDGMDRHLDKGSESYHTNQGFSGYLFSERQPLLIQDVNNFQEVRPALDRVQYPFQSFLGVPLLLAGEFVGTLELASLDRNAYNKNDLDILLLLSGQAAVAINNALLYQQEQRRVVELAGLANLAHAVNSIQHIEELFAQLTENIAILANTKILGFLIYDEDRHLLKGQIPFVGLGDSAIEMYQASIDPGSKGEQIWQDAEVIITSNAAEDERLQALKLHHLAMAAGIRHTVLVPLSSGGRIWGYLQAATKKDDTPFDKNDIRLLSIIAGQAAPIIENATLVQAARRRAQRAETLRRIASLTSSSATTNEILKYSILDLGRLLQSDIATLFLLDERLGELRIHNESVFGISPEKLKQVSRIAVDEPEYPLTITASNGQFIHNDLRTEPDIPLVYQPLFEALGIRSVIIVPLIIRERGIGELMVGSLKEQFFSQGDLQTVAISAGQLASSIEQAALYSQTDQSLRTRVEQLTALTRISRELNTTFDQHHLLERVYNEALHTTRADCGTILVFELNDTWASNPGNGNGSLPRAPKIALRLGEHVCQPVEGQPQASRDPREAHPPDQVLHPLEKIVMDSGEPIIIDEFHPRAGNQNQHVEHLERSPAHPDIRSTMIVPIAYQGQVAGMIHLHSKEPDHFGKAEREFGEALAIQAAIALGNAQRYTEQLQRSELLNRRVETLSSLFNIAQVLQQEQSLEMSLEAIAYAIQSSTSFEFVLISVYDHHDGSLKRVCGAGIPLETMELLKARPQPWKVVQEILSEDYLTGGCYFIPYEKLPVPPAELHTITLQTGIDEVVSEYQWHPEDMLLVPLFDANGEPLGMISVDGPRNALRPDRPTLETLGIFGTQAALLIENHNKINLLRGRLEEIEADLAIARESAVQTKSHLPVLLHNDLEQNLTIQQLSQRSRRINAGLDIAALVGQRSSRSEVLLTLGQEMLSRMDFDVVLIAEGVGDLRLNYILGAIPNGVNPKVLLGQRNPFRQCLANGETLLVSNLLDENSEWHNTPLLRALEAESFICLPIGKNSAEKSSIQPDQVAVLGTYSSAQASFTEDDQQLYKLLARQVMVALQNLSLLEETKRRLNEVNLLLDFSRRLGSLDANSILKTLVESVLNVISSAEGAMVTLWNEARGLLVPKAARGYADDSGLMEVSYRAGEGLSGQVFENRQPVRLDEVDFAKHYNLSPDNLMKYRNAMGGFFPVSSMAVPIVASINPQQPIHKGQTTAGEESTRSVPLGVLVVDNTHNTAAFTDEDLALITSLAHQTALTLENARLYQAAEQRSQQLQALTEVSTTITSSLQTEELIATLLEQLQQILPYDTGILWLREQAQTRSGKSNGNEKMVVRAARGFNDSDQRIGLAVDVSDSILLNEMMNTSQPIYVSNILEDQRFRTISYDLDGEETRPTHTVGYKKLSWLGVPLIASGEVIGVIALEKLEANAYTADDIQVATTFAGQAAVGLENAQLYEESVQRAQELDKRSQTLTILNRLSSELSSSLDAEHIIQTGIREFCAVISSNYVTALKFLPEDQENQSHRASQLLLQAEYPAIEDNSLSFRAGSLLPNTALFQRLSETLGIYSSARIEHERELSDIQKFLEERQTCSLLIVPIASGHAAGSRQVSDHFLHGLLLAHNQENRSYSVEEMELARTISNQIAISLQNARLFEETRSLTEDLELRVQERTAELEKEHQRAETLVRIIKELSASLDLDQVLNNTLQVLGEFVDAAQITVLIARPGTPRLQRLASIGYTRSPAEEGESTPFRIDQGLAGWIITQRQSVLIKDVLEDERWIEIPYPDSPEKSIPRHRSVLGVPLMSGADALGALMLFHHKIDHFSIDQLDLVQAAANQVAVAVNNAELYRLIRDQAEDLGTMLRNQQIETSRSKAILEAVADGVLVTDENRQITLFNESAETILGLERSQVVGKSLEHFSGLFGRAAQSWMETIRNWSRDTSPLETGDTHAEQINLEDGRVISVHLAPVGLQNDFLGTVSIFQDVTHQVEVDRLKSEFVATVSHELRTPMTSIKGYVEVLLMGAGGQLTEQQVNYLQVVKTNTERLAVLVNDLLDISQIEAGKSVLSLQPLNLEKVADQAIIDLKHRSQEDEKPIQIIKDIQPGLPRISGDPERLRQIFDNLLENAYQYNQPGGKIKLRMYQANGDVQVDIQDNGLGIPPADHQRIFQRFYRGENPLVLGISGTGLGLSIVHNLITMHNGRIWFKSTGVPGEGTTFSFTLPLYTRKADDNTDH